MYVNLKVDHCPCRENICTSVSESLSSVFGLGLRAEGEALLAEPALVFCSSLSRRDLAAVADGIPTWVRPRNGLVVGLLPSASLRYDKKIVLILNCIKISISTKKCSCFNSCDNFKPLKIWTHSVFSYLVNLRRVIQ